MKIFFLISRKIEAGGDDKLMNFFASPKSHMNSVSAAPRIESSWCDNSHMSSVSAAPRIESSWCDKSHMSSVSLKAVVGTSKRVASTGILQGHLQKPGPKGEFGCGLLLRRRVRHWRFHTAYAVFNHLPRPPDSLGTGGSASLRALG